MTPPDPLDADLSALHSAVDDLGPWLAIWQARREPDARARRCASDAIDAIDTALAALHRVRARLVSETRQADDQAAARVDRLLANVRDGPPVTLPGDRRQEPQTTSPRPPTSTGIVGRDSGSGGDP
jgi:hypothetical protein